MSVRWITWAWEQECPNPTTKLTLIALADHAGEDGVCWPSSGRLSEKTGQNERTVRRHLDELDERGIIARSRRRRSDGTLGTYTIRLSPADNLSAGPPDTDDRTTGHPVSEPPDTHVRAEPSYEPSVEPSSSSALAVARPRNEIWDALEIELGPAATPTEQRLRGKTVKELKEAGATPTDVHLRCQEYRLRWPSMALTDGALMKHWSMMGKEQPRIANSSPGMRKLQRMMIEGDRDAS